MDQDLQSRLKEVCMLSENLCCIYVNNQVEPHRSQPYFVIKNNLSLKFYNHKWREIVRKKLWKTLKCTKSESRSVMSDSLWSHGLYSPWNSLGQNTGVGSLSLFQETRNPGLLHSRWIFYQLSHQGSPWILEWVAYPFSSRAFQPRNWTKVSFITGRFFTSWATRQSHCQIVLPKTMISVKYRSVIIKV